MLWIGRLALIVGAMCIASGTALAQQTKLKWAHVYETSEPYHKWSVWAANEIEKRTNGKFHIDVFPASSLGKESDINQGLTLGTVDMIISGLSFAARTLAAHRRRLLPVYVPRRRSPDQVLEEPGVQGNGR